MLSLDPLRHLSAAPLSRFSHARVEHPSTRQPGFTVHHGAHSDLTTAGRSNHLKSISSSIYQSLKVSHLQVNKSMRFSRQFLGQPEEASTHESAKTNTASHVVLLLRIEWSLSLHAVIDDKMIPLWPWPWTYKPQNKWVSGTHVPEVFISTSIDVVVFKFREICPTGNRWNCALFAWSKKQTKFRLPLKLSLLLGSRPKSARSSPQQCTQSVSNFIQIGSHSAKL